MLKLTNIFSAFFYAEAKIAIVLPNKIKNTNFGLKNIKLLTENNYIKL